MSIDDYSFHDAIVLTVTEYNDQQTVDYLIDFPTGWKQNKFDKRVLRFTHVITHNVEEIPFAGSSTILKIIDHGHIEKIFGTGSNQFRVDRRRIELETNAGRRLIEFADCILLDANGKMLPTQQ